MSREKRLRFDIANLADTSTVITDTSANATAPVHQSNLQAQLAQAQPLNSCHQHRFSASTSTTSSIPSLSRNRQQRPKMTIKFQRKPLQREPRHPWTVWLAVLPALSVVLTLVWMAVGTNEVGTFEFPRRLLLQRVGGKAAEAEKASVVGNSNGMLTFQACNGFANQRLSIVFGVLSGILSNRDIILPRLPLNGEQTGGGDNIHGGNSKNSILFSRYYDTTDLQTILARYGLQVFEKEVSEDDVYRADCGDKSVFECLEMVSNINQTIDIGCGFPANLVTPEIVLEYEQVFEDVLAALSPIDSYQKEVSRVAGIIREKTGGKKGYNVLHLRIEDDWVEHCQVWENIPDGVIRDNCMGEMETIGITLAGMIEDKTLPLVITYNVNVHKDLYDKAMNSIRAQNFQVITNHDLGLEFYSREVSAMINYFIALEADQFIGNTVSSFSALLILERRSMQKWASYYNGGNIPMQVFLPLYSMPWVVLDNCHNVKRFNEQVLPVLIQGVIVGHLDAYLFCHYESGVDPAIVDIMQQKNITIIYYQDVKHQMQAYNVSPTQFSKIYQIAMMPQLRQYNYLFVTDTNVWFERQVSLDTFGLPLPKFQTDYTLGGEESARIRFVKTQYVREKWIVQGKYENDTEAIPKVVDGGQSGVVSYKHDTTLDTPITCFNEAGPTQKWTWITSCKYQEYQQYSEFCKSAKNVA